MATDRILVNPDRAGQSVEDARVGGATVREEKFMYIGIGTIVLIVIIVLVVLMLRRR